MNFDLDPLILFPSVSILAAALAIFVWRSNRGVAVVAAGLAACSVLCVGNEISARAAHNAIRIDLLLTIPVIGVAAVVVGIFALRRPPLLARINAGALVAVGGISFAWFAWTMTKSTHEAQNLTAIFNRGRKLYWEETIRCRGNLVKRFGSLDRNDRPCYGHLMVTSRSSGAYPYTRAIVNDDGDVYLFFSPEPGLEDNATLGDGAAVRLEPGPGDVLAGESNTAGFRVKVELRSPPGGACEAKIERAGRTSTLTMAKTELPQCEAPVAPPVHFVGAWGNVEPEQNSRRLNQIWLWEAGETARGLYLSQTASSGMRIEFTFVKRLRGSRRAENQWDLQVINDGDDKTEQTLIFTLVDGRARLTGPATLLRTTSGEVLLDPQEVVSHPRIALVPIGDRERFAAYFDNVLFNLNVPWTAP